MKPKKSNLNTGCPDALSTNCVVWNGPSITCLDICHGEVLTDVMWAIADKVCKLANDIDVTEMDISCLLDLCTSCPGEKTLKNIIQLLLDNQCKLKDLIDAIIVDPVADVELNLNLKCLRVFDEFGNEIPQNLNQTLQSMVNELCKHTDQILVLQTTVIDLQNQIDNIEINPTTSEVNISTCIASIRPTSQQVILVADALCDFKEVVGNDTDIQVAIAQQCPNLNPLFSSNPNWDLSPDSLASSFGNLWIAYCNLLARVTNIEKTCCAPSCDKVKIGFITTFNDNNTVTLSFTSGSGSSIPAGFEDCGSILTITNQNNVTFSLPVPIEQGADSEEIDLSLFQNGDMLTFSFDAKLCSDGLVCQKCYGKVVKYINGCCTITNTSDAPISITYQTII